jgi:nucleoside phosphorylase
MPRAVILTAISVEYQAVRHHLNNLQTEQDSQGTRYQRGEFLANGQKWEVGIAQTGAGNIVATRQTKAAIDYFKPDVILFVGIAGGIKDVRIGDVVAATEVYNYELGKIEEQMRYRPKSEKSTHQLVEIAKHEAESPEWLERLSSIQSSQPPNVFVKPIASGEKVVASTGSELFKSLRANFSDAVAVEMEGYGFLHATFADPNIQAIVIRGISDLIDGKNDASIESEEIRQERASRHASAFAFQILSEFKFMTQAVPRRANRSN